MSKKSKQTQRKARQFREGNVDDTILMEGSELSRPKAKPQRARKKGRTAPQHQPFDLDELAAEEEWEEDVDWEDDDDQARRDLRRARSEKARSQEAATDDKPEWQAERD